MMILPIYNRHKKLYENKKQIFLFLFNFEYTENNIFYQKAFMYRYEKHLQGKQKRNYHYRIGLSTIVYAMLVYTPFFITVDCVLDSN